MVEIACVGGSLFAFIILDRIGRVRSMQVSCLLWAIGTIIWITSAGNLGQLYAGRFLAGLGIGFTPVIAPTYIAEVAPRTVRGACVCIFSGSVVSWPCSSLLLCETQRFGTK